MKNNLQYNKFKQGGVSIFAVVAACILAAVIAGSFIRLVLRDQSQSTTQDVSQSAYDSAQAGVEDAKRFFEIYNRECAGGYNDTVKCNNMKAVLTSGDGGTCNMLATGGIGAATGETKVQSSSNGADTTLDQAYTCVKVQRETSDFLGEIQSDQARIVPLKGQGDFNQVRLRWYLPDDRSNSTDNNIALDNVVTPNSIQFPSRSEWQAEINKPPIMKAQFFGFINGGAVSLDQLDDSFAGDGQGLDERIYFPSRGTGATNADSLPTTARRTSATRTTSATPVLCAQDFTLGGYACTVTINLGHTVQANHSAFLRLTSIYNKASFQVEMLNSGGAIIPFDGVQPKVDSTGRANDSFRRVEGRIEFVDPNFPVPDFAVQNEDASNPLCKNFWTTNTTSGGVECTNPQCKQGPANYHSERGFKIRSVLVFSKQKSYT